MSRLNRLLKRVFGRKPKTVRCRICKRVLLSKRAIERGVGPVCAGKQDPQRALEDAGQQRIEGL